MLIGIALRALGRWLQDYAGVGIDSEKYTVEHRSASHVIVHLQDVALTEALWGFVVGPAVPFTAHSGLARDVRVEVSAEKFSFSARGVTLRLRQTKPQEWVAEAEKYRAALLKQKAALLSGKARQSELKRWVKGRLLAEVSGFAVALHTDELPGGGGPCSCVALGSTGALADPPDDLVAGRALGETPEVPFHRAGRDSLLLMAKDIAVRDLRLFVVVGRPLPENWSEAAAWTGADEVCPKLQLWCAYRAWDPTALEDFPECAPEAKKTIVVQASVSDSAAAASSMEPVLLRLDAPRFASLMALFANFDSLYFLWGMVMSGVTRDVTEKPTDEAVQQYIELWKRHHRAAPAFGRDQELLALEHRLAGGFVTRMRHFCDTKGVPSSDGFFFCAGASARRPAAEPTGPSSPRRPGAVIELSPRIAADAAASPFLGLHGKVEQVARPHLSRRAMLLNPFGGRTLEFEAAPGPPASGLLEFLLDSAYKIVVPSLCVQLDLQELATPSGGSEPAVPLGTARLTLPGLCVTYLKNLDVKQILLEGDSATFDVTAKVTRGGQPLGRQRSTVVRGEQRALHWDGLHVCVDYYGDYQRDIKVRGELSLDLLELWPYLQHSPGLRPMATYVEAFGHWYPREVLTDQLRDILTFPDVRRDTVYAFMLPKVQVCLRATPANPAASDLPSLELQLTQASVSFKLSGLVRAEILKVQLLSRQAGLPSLALPVLSVDGMAVRRSSTGPISLDGSDSGSRLCLSADRLEVNLTASLLLVAKSHLRAYDPGIRSSSSSAPPKEQAPAAAAETPSRVPALPLMTVLVPHIQARVWAGSLVGAAEVESKAACDLRVYGAQVRTDGDGSFAEVHVKVGGVLGCTLSSTKEVAVFLCTELEAEGAQKGPGDAALAAAVVWNGAQTEVKLFGACLHVAPVVGILDVVRLLLPGVLPSKEASEGVPPPRSRHRPNSTSASGGAASTTLNLSGSLPPSPATAAAPSSSRTAGAEPRKEAAAAGAAGAASSRVVVQVHHLLLGLHVTPGAAVPALVLDHRGLERDSCAARPAPECLSLVVGAGSPSAGRTGGRVLEVVADRLDAAARSGGEPPSPLLQAQPDAKLTWRFVIAGEVHANLVDFPGASALRVRCTELSVGSSVCEVRELSLEFSRRGQYSAADFPASLVLRGTYVRRHQRASGPSVMEVSIASITGQHAFETPYDQLAPTRPRADPSRSPPQTGSRSRMFMRPFDSDWHLHLSYVSGRQLFLYVAPTALRLHRDWVEPATAFAKGMKHWSSGLRLSAAPSSEAGPDGRAVAAAWEGVAWELQRGGPAGGLVARRARVQVRADGTIWEESPVGDAKLLLSSTLHTAPQPTSAPLFFWGLRAEPTYSAGNSVGVCELAFDSAQELAAVRQIVNAARETAQSTRAVTMSSMATMNHSGVSSVSSQPVGKFSTGALFRATGLRQRSRATNMLQQAGVTIAESLRGMHAAAVSMSPTLGNATAMSPAPTSPPPVYHQECEGNGMAVDVEIKGLEFWLPALGGRDDDSELGFLIVLEAQGTIGNNLKVQVPCLAAVYACPGCWKPGDALRAEPVNPTDHVTSLESAFASVTRWSQSEGGATTPSAPSSPAHLPESYMGRATSAAGPADSMEAASTDVTFAPVPSLFLAEPVQTPLRAVARGTPQDDQLMDTRGLALVVVWEPQCIVGVRLDGMAVFVPVELLGYWAGLQGHISALAAACSGWSGPPGEDSPVVGAVNSADHAACARRQSELEGGLAPAGGGGAEAGGGRCCCCCWPRGARKNMPRLKTPDGLGYPLSDSDGQDASEPWKVELDVAGRIDLTLSGGLLAPAHWLVVRLSDIALRGPAPLQDSYPLSGMCRCDIKCYDAQAAQLEQVLEPVEVTVDAQQGGRLTNFAISTARINLNVHRVLVDFFDTVNRRLREAGGAVLKPIRTFSVVNETGVSFELLWPGALETLTLASGQSAPRGLHGVRAAELRFSVSAAGDEEDCVRIELDHSHSRAYLLPASGCPVFVEPEIDLRTGQCTLRVRSAVAIHNHTAIPLSVHLIPGKTRLGRAAEKVSNVLGAARDPSERRELDVQPHSVAHVPLDWFSSRAQATRIKPAVDCVPPKSFPQLSHLLEACVRDTDFLDDFSASANAPGMQQLEERMKFNLFFHTYLKLIGYVDARDVPMECEAEDSRPAQCFAMHLNNVVTFRNMLPFPIGVQLCPMDNVLAAQAFPADVAHEVLTGHEGIGDGHDPAGASVPCFSIDDGGPKGPQVRWTSELDGILRLTLGRTKAEDKSDGKACEMVASYILGVDQELALPFAKRSLHMRAISLGDGGQPVHPPKTHRHLIVPELAAGTPRPPIFASSGDYVLLAPNHSHKPWSQTLILWQRENGAPALKRSVFPCLQKSAAAPSDAGPQPLQIVLEMTRNSVVFYAPVVMENLTPFTFCIDPTDPTAVLEPNCRRVLPRSQQLKDAAFVALHEEAHLEGRSPASTGVFSNNSAAVVGGQEIAGVSELNRSHHLQPMKRPGLLPGGGNEACGLILGNLSFGVCVRMAAAPLRLTRVVSIFPRFIVKSELDRTITIHFEGCRESCVLHPGERVPVHPPTDAAGAVGQQGMYLVERDSGHRSNTFSIHPRSDDDERRRIFHVRYEAGEGMSPTWDSKSRFIQVDIQQAVFPSKDQVPFTDGYFVILRDQDFRGTEDAVFHIENCTAHRYIIRMGGDGSKARMTGGILGPARGLAVGPVEEWSSDLWVHKAQVNNKDQESKYRDVLQIFQDHQCKRPLERVDLGTILTARPNSTIATFELRAKLHLKSVEDDTWPERVLVDGIVASKSDFDGFAVQAKLWVVLRGSGLLSVVADDEPPEPPERAPSTRVSATALAAEAAARGALREGWRVASVGGAAVEPGDAWRVQLREAVATGAPLSLVKCVELRHCEGEDGVHHFKIQRCAGGCATDTRKAQGWQLRVNIPVLSVSWVHRHCEVLAARVRGVELRHLRERSGEAAAEIAVQHFQVDHFMEGELPVVLNRRFLHINSRWLGKKALEVSARWVSATHIIRSLEIDVVPYWLNLEIGVLIRLWDLAESSFISFAHQAEDARTPLEPPQQPTTGEESVGKHTEVWRMMKLAMRPLRVTVMVRSPDMAVVRDNPTARWIMRLPTDMPNMDVLLPQVELTDQFGSRQQIFAMLKRKYKRTVKYSALRSLILSYLATILKGILNALWWLFRGPFDALTVASEIGTVRQSVLPCTWWIPPLVQGTAEGTYRAMADLVGNSVFFVVLVLNAVRHFTIGATRPRAQSLLDGIVYGFRGFVLDTCFVTSIQQVLLQTRIAYQDWGSWWAAIVFVMWCIMLPLGPTLGALHFAASCCEGLAHILLHEEAQFAPFEPQRTIESEAWNPYSDSQDSFRMFGPEGSFPMASSDLISDGAPKVEVPKKWWLFHVQQVTRAIADDDEVMERVRLPVQFALHS